MKKIMLACLAGMSSSIVVSKMKAEAQARGIDYHIYAIPEGSIGEELARNSEEVIAILLGPQVGLMRKAVEKVVAPYGIPVDVIDVKDYGTANGANILDQALRLANSM